MKYIKCRHVTNDKCKFIASGSDSTKVTNYFMRHVKKDHPQFIKKLNTLNIIQLKQNIKKNHIME